jgi:hypothetical protein
MVTYRFDAALVFLRRLAADFAFFAPLMPGFRPTGALSKHRRQERFFRDDYVRGVGCRNRHDEGDLIGNVGRSQCSFTGT